MQASRPAMRVGTAGYNRNTGPPMPIVAQPEKEPKPSKLQVPEESEASACDVAGSAPSAEPSGSVESEVVFISSETDASGESL